MDRALMVRAALYRIAWFRLALWFQRNGNGPRMSVQTTLKALHAAQSAMLERSQGQETDYPTWRQEWEAIEIETSRKYGY